MTEADNSCWEGAGVLGAGCFDLPLPGWVGSHVPSGAGCPISVAHGSAGNGLFYLPDILGVIKQDIT